MQSLGSMLCELKKQLSHMACVSYAVCRPTRSSSHVNRPGISGKVREQVFVRSVVADAQDESGVRVLRQQFVHQAALVSPHRSYLDDFLATIGAQFGFGQH